MIIWKFKGTDTKFRSTPASHQRDIFKMSKACGVPPETEIIYEHGKPNGPAVKDVFAINSDTPAKKQSTIQKSTKTRKPRKQAPVRLPDLSRDVDSTNFILDAVEGGFSTSGTSGSGNSISDGGDGQDTH